MSATATAVNTIVFSHMGQQFVAEETPVIKDGYVLHEIYSPEDVFMDNIFLHPNEDKIAALTTWSAYH